MSSLGNPEKPLPMAQTETNEGHLDPVFQTRPGVQTCTGARRPGVAGRPGATRKLRRTDWTVTRFGKHPATKRLLGVYVVWIAWCVFAWRELPQIISQVVGTCSPISDP